MQFWRFSVLLQRARVEALVQAADLHIAAWDILSARYHVPNRPDERVDHLLRTYQEQARTRVYRGDITGKIYNRDGSTMSDGAEAVQHRGVMRPGMTRPDLFYEPPWASLSAARCTI